MERRLRTLGFSLLLLLGGALQAATVKGKILDAQGQPLPGASVVVEEFPGKGTAADFDGNFEISGLPTGTYTLTFSFIGFETQKQEITIQDDQETKTLTITLEESNSRLDEVVVVGYGVQRKRDVVGNIAKLDGKEVQDMPAPSFEAALQGKAAGVQIQQSGGMAGGGTVVRVRGIASIGGGGDPLYIVDGVQINQDYFASRSLGRADAGGMNQNPLAFLNPDDIESIEILKDASATAIYGSRGANGVVLITTKRGSKAGKLRFNFSTTQGVSLPTQRPEMLDAQQWLDLYEEAWINDGNVGTPTGLPAGLTWEEAQRYNTDWVDETIRTGYKQFYDFGVEKGTEKFNFYAGVSYDANQSYIEGDQYNRLSARFNGDWRVSDDLEIQLSSNGTQAVYHRVDNGPAGGLGAAMSSALPIYPIRYDRDVYQADEDNPGDSSLLYREGDYWFEAGANNNPTGLRELKQWRNTEWRTINNLSLNYSPLKNFTLSASGSLDYSFFTEDMYEPVGNNSYIAPSPILGQGIAKRWPRTSLSYNTHLTASYIHDINEDHQLTYMVGGEYLERESRVKRWLREVDTNVFEATNEVFDANGPFYEDDRLRDTLEFDSVQLENQRRFLSFFGRVNYSYKNRYLAQVVLRADGSSSFGPENRYGFFPSIAGGWIISDEPWMKYNRVINYLKLKSSIGFIGNANIDQNRFQSLYAVNDVGYNNNPIRFPTIAPNPALKWETTEIFDLGIEFGLWEDRITGEMSYYRKNTRDVLMQVALPQMNGFDNFYDNVGSVLNYGVEFAISTNNIAKGDWSWRTDFNIAFNRNRILSLGGYSEDAVAGGTNDTRVVEGQSIGTFYMVPVIGIDEQTGDPIYRSITGEETRVYDQANRVPVGKGIPDAIGGITNTVTWKNWTFSTLFVFSIGADVYDHSAKYQQTGWPVFGNFWNFTPQVYDRWTRPGDEARLPRLTLDNTSYEGLEDDFWNTSLWVSDASYLRLRNVTVSYRFDQEDAQKIGLEGLTLSLVGTNVLTFTNFRGLDPEVARDFTDVTDRNMSLNTTYLTAPQEQTYSVRITANF